MKKNSCSGQSAGALIIRREKLLLLDRAFAPLGWAPPAGHIEKGETPDEAIRREIKEEVGLEATECELLANGKKLKDVCVAQTELHDWWVFKCKCRNKIKLDKKESLRFKWIPVKKIREAEIIGIWKYWFKKIKI